MGHFFSKPIDPSATTTDQKKPTSDKKMVKRAALICIDGWGVRTENHGNAILQAATPVMDGFRDGAEANWGVVAAHGLAVGLPDGVMGNSEVGHLTIGAGQVEYQDLVRINLTVSQGKLPSVPNLVAAFESAKKGTGRLHLFGLLSDGGVHSHIDHLFAILDAAKAAGVPRVLLHMCLDGRDVSPTSGPTYVAQVRGSTRPAVTQSLCLHHLGRHEPASRPSAHLSMPPPRRAAREEARRSRTRRDRDPLRPLLRDGS